MNVIDRLLDSDAAIRRQVLRDLTDASSDEVAAERARVAREGWGAQLLAASARAIRADGSRFGLRVLRWAEATALGSPTSSPAST